jgi:NAD(P)-dependent dehydrogenase (short-subunit alcohol dehydrogenase family)
MIQMNRQTCLLSLGKTGKQHDQSTTGVTTLGKLRGKVAVITGGTEGIGLATAALFAKEGAYVFITGRRQKKLDEAVETIGSNVSSVQGDIANLDDLDRLYATVAKVKGQLDVVFANAGVGEFASLGDVSEEHYNKIFNVNVKGTIFTVQKALPLINNGGSIILNGSAATIMRRVRLPSVPSFEGGPQN